MPAVPLGEQDEQVVRHLGAARGDQVTFEENAALDVRIDRVAFSA